MNKKKITERSNALKYAAICYVAIFEKFNENIDIKAIIRAQMIKNDYDITEIERAINYIFNGK